MTVSVRNGVGTSVGSRGGTGTDEDLSDNADGTANASDGKAGPTIERPDLVGVKNGIGVFLSQLHGLVAVDATPGVARIPGSRPGSFARGMDVALTFEPQAWTAGGLYLLAGVLERFFALQVSINGFVRTSAHLRGRSGPIASWPARSGTKRSPSSARSQRQACGSVGVGQQADALEP